MAAAGRGRGRGRGWYSKCVYSEGVLSQNQLPSTSSRVGTNPPLSPTTPVITPQLNSSNTSRTASQYQQNLQNRNTSHTVNNNKSSQPTAQQNGATRAGHFSTLLTKTHNKAELKKLIAEEINNNKTKENIDDFVNAVTEKSLQEPDFGTTGADLCNQLWVAEDTHTLIKGLLLTSVQNKYKNRKEFKRERFYGLAVFLCELFNVLRMKDLALKPLNEPVCTVLKELIENTTDLSDDDVFYFFQELERIGETIESVSKDSIEEIMNLLRPIIIKNETLRPSNRCRLVQLIELHASRWKLSEDVKAQYEDMNQDLMAEGL